MRHEVFLDHTGPSVRDGDRLGVFVEPEVDARWIDAVADEGFVGVVGKGEVA
jgi:hypothetical protein